MAPLTGRALVAAMCLGQVGNLLPHVVVPAIMAQYLMPLWNLSASQAGLMASAYAFGYMLAVPGLTALTDRIDARGILLGGSLVSGLATIAFGWFAAGRGFLRLALGLLGDRRSADGDGRRLSDARAVQAQAVARVVAGASAR